MHQARASHLLTPLRFLDTRLRARSLLHGSKPGSMVESRRCPGNRLRVLITVKSSNSRQSALPPTRHPELGLAGQIPAALKLPGKVICHVQHPCLCMRDITTEMRQATELLSKATGKLMPGTALRMRAQAEDGSSHTFFKAKAYSERDGQVVLVDCAWEEVGLSLNRIDGQTLAFEVGESAIAKVWRACSGPPRTLDVCVLLAREPVSLKAACVVIPIGLGADGETSLLWPPPPPPPPVPRPTAPAAKAGASTQPRDPFAAVRLLRHGEHQGELATALPAESEVEDEGAIAALELSMAGALKKARRQVALRKKAGKLKGGKSKLAPRASAKRRAQDDVAKAAKVARAGPASLPLPAAADVPVCAATVVSPSCPAEVPQRGQPPSSAGAAGPKALACPREDRQEIWGEFSIAPLHRRIDGQKVHIGWGANCWKHNDSSDCSGARCQKQVTCPPNSSQEALDEVRRLAKVWLLMGRGLPADASNSRSWHLKDLGGARFRSVAPSWTEAECDAMLCASARPL